MPNNRTKNMESSEASISIQPFILLIVAVFGAILLLAPFLPVIISNTVYSLSGDKPKIYWYLSRSAGFVTLSILWVAMALGLGITNKLARRWPGAPTAFATHQYVSLLGLAFSAYHALVLIGDHYVDFSLPRLLTPFSIEYKGFWVGLGQVSFYVWIIVVLSFYVRKYIGQSTWRLIHFANFAMYLFGLLHGIFSGTDTQYEWAQVYYLLSGLSLSVLLGYRLYQTVQEKRSPRTKAVRQRPQPGQQVPAPTLGPAPVAAKSELSATAPEQVSPPTDQPNTIIEPVQPARGSSDPDLAEIPVQVQATPTSGVQNKKKPNGSRPPAQTPPGSPRFPFLQIKKVDTPSKQDVLSPWEKIYIRKVRIKILPAHSQANRPSVRNSNQRQRESN